MRLWQFLTILFLGVACIIGMTVWFFPPTTDFRPQNPLWNGLEDFQREFQATLLDSLLALPEDAERSVLVVIPYVKPTKAEVAQLRSYLEAGGVLILADDYGYGNTVLEGFGVPARFSGAPLLDPIVSYRTSSFPLAANLAPSPLTAGVSSIALNYATVLENEGDEGDEGLTVVASSSAFSYLDLDGDGTRDVNEPVGPLPVAGHAMVGTGLLILVADPTIFINAMFAAEDNRLFVRNLVSSGGAHRQLYLDLSHLPPSRLNDAKRALASIRNIVALPGILSALVVLVPLVIMAIWWRRKGVLIWTRTN